MSLGDGIYERQSKTVTGGMFSLYESFENLAANISGESWAIVFNHQYCCSLMGI